MKKLLLLSLALLAVAGGLRAMEGGEIGPFKPIEEMSKEERGQFIRRFIGLPPELILEIVKSSKDAEERIALAKMLQEGIDSVIGKSDLREKVKKQLEEIIAESKKINVKIIVKNNTSADLKLGGNSLPKGETTTVGFFGIDPSKIYYGNLSGFGWKSAHVAFGIGPQKDFFAQLHILPGGEFDLPPISKGTELTPTPSSRRSFTVNLILEDGLGKSKIHILED